MGQMTWEMNQHFWFIRSFVVMIYSKMSEVTQKPEIQAAASVTISSGQPHKKFGGTTDAR
jgi:hypothetical protein